MKKSFENGNTLGEGEGKSDGYFGTGLNNKIHNSCDDIYNEKYYSDSNHGDWDDLKKLFLKIISENSNDINSVAIHEAGHAVIYHLLNHRIDYVEVNENGNGIVKCLIYRPHSFADCLDKLEIEMYNYGLLSFAGYIAEYKFLNKNLDINHLYNIKDVTKDNDFLKFKSEMKKVNKIINERKYSLKYFKYIFNETKELINNELVWNAIIELSNELIVDNFLDTKKVHEILSKHIPRDYSNSKVYGIPIDTSFMTK